MRCESVFALAYLVVELQPQKRRRSARYKRAALSRCFWNEQDVTRKEKPLGPTAASLSSPIVLVLPVVAWAAALFEFDVVAGDDFAAGKSD